MELKKPVSKTKVAVIMATLALVCMLLAACGQNQSSQSKASTFSEGVDTSCTVSYPEQAAPAGISFLSEGDSIAVISPSTLPSKEQVSATIDGLKSWGYVPVEGKHVLQDNRTLQDCVEDLTWALQDPSIKAIFCVRGGYGVSEVVDALPNGLIASAKKPIIGYSDITVLHSAWTSAGVPSIHASMSASFTDLPKECVAVEQKILRGEIPSYSCKGSNYDKEGHAEGFLIGGNLSTFTSVLGTAYDCSKIDQPFILFLEDESEDLQHVHRYLTLLKHLGVLDRAAGIVFGEWVDVPNDMADYDGSSRGGKFTSMSDMISRQFTAELGVPVAFGFPAGHGDTNYPLLMGANASLDVSGGNFTLGWKTDSSAENSAKQKAVYFAAPLFNEGEKEFNLKLTKVLEDHGYKVFLPQRDGYLAAELEGKSETELTEMIFAKDYSEVMKADICFVNLDGRAPDEGACVELGIAYASGKRCYAAKTDARSVEYGMDINPMITGCCLKVFKNLDGDKMIAELEQYLSEHEL